LARSDAARAASLAALLLAGGCAAAGAPARDGEPARGGWLAARGRDLARVFDLTLSIGPGLGARASLTRHAQAGLIVVDSVEPSPHHGKAVNLTVGLRDGEAVSWSLRSVEYGVSPWYRGQALVRDLDTAEGERRVDPSQARDGKLSAQLHLAIVGAEVGFDPVALWDFFAGCFGFGGSEAAAEPAAGGSAQAP
jgi:hypothetical protein